MKLGMQVSLGPGHIVLDADPAHPALKGHSPQFSAHIYCGQMAAWIKMPLGNFGMEVGLGSGDFVLDGDPAPLPKKGTEPPIFGPCLLWPNAWMHQDATWYGGRSQPRGLCVRWGPSSLPKKGAEPPIFGSCLLRPNACMDQDATWDEGRPRPRRHCVRWGPSSPLPKRGPELPKFSAHVFCGQTARLIKMTLGMEVGLSLSDFVLDADPAPPAQKGGGAQLPNFRPMFIVAKRLD